MGDYELTAKAAIIGEEELQESAPLHQRIHVYIADDPFADGIGGPTPDPSRHGGETAGAVFDLQGRQIRHSSFDTRHSSFLKGQASKLERVTRHLPKGIYIVNGKKVVVR